MNNDLEYWIWLSELPGIGPVLQKRLLDVFKNPFNIYQADKEALLSIPGIGYNLANAVFDSSSLDSAFKRLDELAKKKIKILKYDDLKYPEHAKEWPHNPVIFYYQGNLKKCDQAVSIVGSRRCSAYGKRVSTEAAEYLAHQQIPVISGLAKGIDAIAHTACLKAGGYTMAFPGSGFDHCYPKEHIRLQEKIIENGVIISQFPPETKVHPKYFLKRNEQIASFCKQILIVEAGAKSGALNTAQIAADLKRKILVPPHEIYDTRGLGCNLLLQKTAELYLDPRQLTDQYPSHFDADCADYMAKNTVDKKLTANEEKIIELLDDCPKSVLQLAEKTGFTEVTLLELLSDMELEGLLICQNGYYKLGQMNKK
jgi:DNA processing protein